MNQKQEFWTCVIGPADRNQLPFGSDGPMKRAVQSAFYDLTGENPEVCSSGWGNDSKTAAEASLKESFVYAVEKTNTPEPKLRKLTSGEILRLLTNFAKEYSPKGVESIKRNRHMNKVTNENEISQKIVDATLVDFINYIACQYGVDYGLYTSGLTTSKEPIEFNVDKK